MDKAVKIILKRFQPPKMGEGRTPAARLGQEEGGGWWGVPWGTESHASPGER